MTFVQCLTNVEDVAPTLYKCYTNVLCLLGSPKHDYNLFYVLLIGNEASAFKLWFVNVWLQINKFE